jgi:hypothetical protein
MANDRLYIICPCGEWTMLYKYYPGTGYIGEGAEDFLRGHALLCSRNNSPAEFSLVWENKAAEITHKPLGKAPCPMEHPK